MMTLSDTQKKILKTAEQEFMACGFQKASLRNIAKTAGLTTGAVYGYYPDKESLFAALVSKPANELIECFIKMQNNHAMLTNEEKITNTGMSMKTGIAFFCEYIYEHHNAFYLIACCSEGTKYQSYIDDMVAIEEKAMHTYLEFLIEENKISRTLDKMLVHILISSSFNSVFEVARHNMTKDKTMEYAKELSVFYVAGWNKLLGFSS